MAGAKPEKDYIAEYSKSDRSTCKICRKRIAKDSLRIGHYIQSARFDGWVANWHHAHCFLGRKKEPITSPYDIEGFSDLKFSDQQKIKELIEKSEALTPAEATKASGPLAGGPAEGFQIEYAKSARAKCRHCDKVIEQNDIRMGPMGRMDHRPYLAVPEWHHVDCFFDSGKWEVTPNDLDGFGNMTKEDQTMLKQRMEGERQGSGSSNAKDTATLTKQETRDLDISKSKRSTRQQRGDTKLEPKAPVKEHAGKQVEEEHHKHISSDLTAKEERELKEHSEKLFAIRKHLHDIGRKTLKHILEANGQDSQGGESHLQGRLADIMLHGAPQPCPRCGGSIKFEDGHYKCTGWVDEYTQCQFKSPILSRKSFHVPDDVEDEYLKHFKFIKHPVPKALRKVEQEAEEYVSEKTKHLSESASRASSPEREQSPRPTNPLEGMVFALHATKSHRLKEEELKHKIHSAGALTMTRVSKRVTHVLTTPEAFEDGGAAITAASQRNMPVVTEEFVDACIAAGAPVSEKKYLLAGKAREESDDNTGVIGKRKEREGSVPKNALVVEKGERGVDLESGVAEGSHVYSKGKDVYSVVLNHTDLAAGLNTFYVLQVIQSNSRKATYLWRKWGRIGTDIKNHKLEEMSLKDCIEEFKKLFQEKTGNPWENHTPDKFEQIAGKFSIAEVGLGIGAESLDKKHKSTLSDSGSTLEPAVRSLVHMMFDTDLMHKAMQDMNIDMTKLPFGELSTTQLHKGYHVLCEIQSLLEDEKLDDFERNQNLLSASNRFYNIVPQNFGPGGVTESQVIDSHEKLVKNTELVDSLIKLEKMLSMQRAGETEMEEHFASEKYYGKLRTSVRHIQQHEPIFHTINTYLKNTHMEASSYGVDIIDAFEIEREHEKTHIRKFEDVKNRLLLWHGSRVTNWASILSEGLRIAPPDAPSAAYAFGKVSYHDEFHSSLYCQAALGEVLHCQGLYFADMASRSASGCFPSRIMKEGLMLLSEVVLGQPLEVFGGRDYDLPARLPHGTISVKARGRREPDPEESQSLPDGVMVPCGRGKKTHGEKAGELEYNEYVVYNPHQALSRFLVRVRFNFD